MSNIKHVILIVQENHTFDAYFGRYCQAEAGSNPSCNEGPACCERAPDKEPGGESPTALDDFENGDYDPDHTQPCELDEMNGGKMDRYTHGASCSDVRNFAIATDEVMGLYHGYAKQYAIGDRYFQPLVGQSSANDMYFAVAKQEFKDNDYKPDGATGDGCIYPPNKAKISYDHQTIADVLLDHGESFGVYAGGYKAMKDSFTCPSLPSDCTLPVVWPYTPCNFDPTDIPFEYYPKFVDNDTYLHDFDQLTQDIDANQLPSFSYVKQAGYKNEHPGYKTKISMSTKWVDELVTHLLSTKYADDTLVLITWDEGGGFFDHVTPPANSPVDEQPYGTRVPILAVGRFAKKNFVSHVVMEHSSVVRFLEYNFTGQVGQLAARDAVVNNLGSLLDPAETGLVIPE